MSFEGLESPLDMKIPVINELFREGLQVQIKMLLSSACNSIAYEILTVTVYLEWLEQSREFP